jgi:hypothetical protein
VESFYQGTRHHDLNDWGPRVGFNYAFNPNVSLRCGCGIYYDRIALEIMSFEKCVDGRALALNVTAGNVITDSSLSASGEAELLVGHGRVAGRGSPGLA